MTTSASLKAVVFDFVGVVADFRMAVANDPGTSRYVVMLHEAVVDRIRDLRRAGYRTGLITNNDRHRFLAEAPDVPLDELFDVVVFSSDLGVGKPDARIFRHALAQLGVEAEAAIFLDDTPRNVDAALGLGMQGAVIDRPERAAEIVDQLLAD